jgi:hypothetical protein
MSGSVGTFRRNVRLRALGAVTAALGAVALVGCGLGAGDAPTAINLTVTHDFGAHTVRSWSAPQVRGQETVMSLLMRNATVTTRYSGGFVQSIDGLSGGEAGGQPSDWFYYVNGVQAPQGAAATNVNPGDHIWWDLHDWSQTDGVPAVVGSFPEPFVNGIDGKRLPVRVECAVISSEPCQTVSSRWTAVSGDPSTHQIELRPRSSGVYARFAANGATLTLLNEQGAVARTLTAGAGLIAATRSAEAAPVWVITGTDDAGVEQAARAFNQATLANHFALALAPGGSPVPVPVSASASVPASVPSGG